MQRFVHVRQSVAPTHNDAVDRGSGEASRPLTSPCTRRHTGAPPAASTACAGHHSHTQSAFTPKCSPSAGRQVSRTVAAPTRRPPGGATTRSLVGGAWRDRRWLRRGPPTSARAVGLRQVDGTALSRPGYGQPDGNGDGNRSRRARSRLNGHGRLASAATAPTAAPLHLESESRARRAERPPPVHIRYRRAPVSPDTHCTGRHKTWSTWSAAVQRSDGSTNCERSPISRLKKGDYCRRNP
jgi:hypothetical protein